MGSKPSDLSTLPSGMHCPGVSGKQALVILSRQSTLKMLLLYQLVLALCVCVCVCVCARARECFTHQASLTVCVCENHHKFKMSLFTIHALKL